MKNSSSPGGTNASSQRLRLPQRPTGMLVAALALLLSCAVTPTYPRLTQPPTIDEMGKFEDDGMVVGNWARAHKACNSRIRVLAEQARDISSRRGIAKALTAAGAALLAGIGTVYTASEKGKADPGVSAGLTAGAGFFAGSYFLWGDDDVEAIDNEITRIRESFAATHASYEAFHQLHYEHWNVANAIKCQLGESDESDESCFTLNADGGLDDEERKRRVTKLETLGSEMWKAQAALQGRLVAAIALCGDPQDSGETALVGTWKGSVKYISGMCNASTVPLELKLTQEANTIAGTGTFRWKEKSYPVTVAGTKDGSSITVTGDRTFTGTVSDNAIFGTLINSGGQCKDSVGSLELRRIQ